MFDTSKKNSSESEVQQAFGFYDVVLNSMVEGLYTVDLDGAVFSMNPAAERMLGWSLDEIRGQKMHNVMHYKHKDGTLFAIEECMVRSVLQKGKVIKDREDVFVRRDGSCFDVMYSSSPLRERRRLIGYVILFHEITERKRAAAMLDRYRLLSERSTDIIWFADTDGNFVDVNAAAIKTYGYTREEFLGMNLRDIRHASTHQELAGQINVAAGSGIHFESLHVRKDGTVFPVDVKANGGEFGDEKLVMGIVRDVSERKNSEAALRESEERRQLAQEAGQVGVWEWDIAKGTTYWSEMMWTFFGEEPRDVNPDEEFWSSHVHMSDRERVKAHIRQVVESQETRFHDEFRITNKDGTVRWIESTAQVSRDGSGAATRIYGVNIDITERKDTEARIRLSENQLRLVTNAVPALISYVDSSERFRFVNQKFTEWFGIPSDQFLGKRVKDVVGIQAYRVIKPQIDAALTGDKCAIETVLNYKHAGTRYVHMSYVPDIGVDGTIYGYYGLTHDLSELKRSQDLLRSSEDRISLMMESFTDYAIFSLDHEGRIDSWNKGAETIFGYSQDEIIGRSSEILFTSEDVAKSVPNAQMRIARQKGRALDDRWHLRKDGARFFASGVMMPLFVGNVLTGYAKIASDLTEKERRAEELQQAHDELERRVGERTIELARSNKALIEEMAERDIAERQRIDLLGRLVTSQEFERRRIARDLHDQLGQPVTALRLKIASLAEFSADNADISTRVERLQEISERLDSEVSFLAWELRPTALDDLGLVEAVGAFVDEWSRHYEIAAEFHSSGLSNERLELETETHLYRITQEALNNILKHAKAKNVTVLLEKRDSTVTLIIEDDGAGFDPAKNVDKGEVSKGLGLVGMGERAALIGGNVEIESARGKGVTIYVRIPVYN